jgi:hypothetical protein
MLGVGPVRAQELVSARVLFIEGQVEIRRQSGDQPVAMKIAFTVEERLKPGDTIVTGGNGRLALGLSDGSQAVIAPKTTVVIQDLSRSPRTLFNVIKGKTRVHIEKLGGQPNPYRVNTPTAVIAVRGTVFDVLVRGDGTEVFLHEGEVVVTNLRAPDQPVFLFAGQMTKVSIERPPNRPSQFKAGRNDGTFKARGNDGAPQDSRRIADGGPRPDSGRGSRPDGARPDFGRGGAPPVGGSQPDFGRGGVGGSQPDFGRGAPPAGGSRPNAGSGPSGRRP